LSVVITYRIGIARPSDSVSLRGVRTAGQGFEAVEHVAPRQHRVPLGDRLVARDKPRILVGTEPGENLSDRGTTTEVESGPARPLGQEASERAVHHHGHRHAPAALTRGMTSCWKRSITTSIRPPGGGGRGRAWAP